MFEAYRTKTRAPITFVDLPPFDGDGHLTIMRIDTTIWAAAVGEFLAGLPKN